MSDSYVNYVKVNYEKNGKRLKKEFTSKTKSCSELRDEFHDWERSHDVKVKSVTSGGKHI